MKGRVAPGRACERAFYADQQSDRIGYILTLSIDYDKWLCQEASLIEGLLLETILKAERGLWPAAGGS